MSLLITVPPQTAPGCWPTPPRCPGAAWRPSAAAWTATRPARWCGTGRRSGRALYLYTIHCPPWTLTVTCDTGELLDWPGTGRACCWIPGTWPPARAGTPPTTASYWTGRQAGGRGTVEVWQQLVCAGTWGATAAWPPTVWGRGGRGWSWAGRHTGSPSPSPWPPPRPRSGWAGGWPASPGWTTPP